MAMRVVALLALLMMAGVHAADDANETAPEVLVAERDAAIDEHPQTNALGGESDAQSSTNNMVRNVQHRNAYLQKNQLNKAGTPTGGGLKAFGSSNKVKSGKADAAKAEKTAKLLALGKEDNSAASQNDCEYSGNVQKPCAAKPCGDHGFLVEYRCYCQTGWVGPNCTVRACKDNCNAAGMCQNGTCVCDENVTGTFCGHCKAGFNAGSFPLCSPDVASCAGNCSGHGQCELNGICTCEPPFSGNDCGFIACPSDCSGHGQCETDLGRPRGVLRGECVCDKNWGEKDCSIGSCPNMCSGNGLCHKTGVCACNPGWSGPDCAVRQCPNACSGQNNGKCIDGKCICKNDFAGKDCSIPGGACAFNCSLRGLCRHGECSCFTGYEGKYCSLMRCPGDCNCDPNVTATGAKSNFTDCNGLCDKTVGRCRCMKGFKGIDCAEIEDSSAGSFGCHKTCTDSCSKDAATAAGRPSPAGHVWSNDEMVTCVQQCEGSCVATGIKPAGAEKDDTALPESPDASLSKAKKVAKASKAWSGSIFGKL